MNIKGIAAVPVFRGLLTGAIALALVGCGAEGSDNPIAGDNASSSSQASASSSSGGTSSSSSAGAFLPSAEVGVTTGTATLDNVNVLYVWDDETPTSDLVIGPKVHVHVRRCVQVNTTLTIKAGAVLSFDEDACLDIQEGKLLVQGAEGDSVYFKPAEGKYWGYGGTNNLYSGGIWISEGAKTGSEITYAVIDSAKTGLYVDEADAMTLTRSRISNSKFMGMDLAEKNAVKAVANNLFVNNLVYDVYMADADNVLRFDGSDKFVGAKAEVAIGGNGAISASGTIPAFDVSYLVLSDLTLKNADANIEVDIAAGASFRFMEGGYIDVDENAKLNVKGTQEKPVRMNTAEVGKYWGYGSTASYSGGIWFSANAAAENQIAFLELDSAKTGIFTNRENALVMRNSALRRCQYYGLNLAEDYSLSTDGLEDNSFADNGTHHILTAAANVVDLGDGNLFSGDNKGIQVQNGHIQKSGTLQAYSAPYIIEGLEIGNDASDVTLTIEPAAKLLFKEGADLVIGERGKLVAVGTATDSIVFDQAASGKYWGSGSTSDWSGGVWFATGSLGEQDLAYVSIRNANTGIMINDDITVKLSNSTIAKSKFYAVHVAEAGAVLTASNVNYAGNASGNVLTEE